MAELLDSVENSVWHAFDFMALEGNGTVTKTKLKVSITFLFCKKYIHASALLLLANHSFLRSDPISQKDMTFMAPILKIDLS